MPTSFPTESTHGKVRRRGAALTETETRQDGHFGDKGPKGAQMDYSNYSLVTYAASPPARAQARHPCVPWVPTSPTMVESGNEA